MTPSSSFRFALPLAVAVVGVACTTQTSTPTADSGADGAATVDASTDAVTVDAAEPTDPANLQPPPPGQGVHMTTGAFDVPAGTEVQDCYFFQVSALEQAAGLPTTLPIDVHRVQIVQKAG